MTRRLNLGILAHVDAGKTSLTERLLHRAGVIDRPGSVDAGTTWTDSLALERQRGITIKSAVVSFALHGVAVNLIDTPGHPDFISEVEPVLDVLDGAVLVVSAVEGVQAQTRVLMRALRRAQLPTLIFVNKIDRRGALQERLLQALGEQLTPAILAMGEARQLGTRAADFVPYENGHAGHTARVLERLADLDDSVLAAYLADEGAISVGALHEKLRLQAWRGLLHPVYFGSALSGAGIEALTHGIAELLPAQAEESEGPVSGRIFKLERGPSGERVAYARLFSGSLHIRERVRIRGEERKVTAVQVFDQGGAVPRSACRAGQIAKLWGLGDVRIGEAIGAPPKAASAHHFAPPTLETVIVARKPADQGALRIALGCLAEQDPLIQVRQDDARQELYVSLYGEVQKEVIQATLSSDFQLEVEFRETTPICIERPAGSGAALEVLRKEPNPFLATVGLRVAPGAPDAGVDFRLEVERGSVPAAFLKAIEEAVHSTLRQGLQGWQVTDCTVTLTHSGYLARQSPAHGSFDRSMSSTAGDFRSLTPLVLMSALQQAGTAVYEPVYRFRFEAPLDTLGTLLPALTRLHAAPGLPVVRGGSCTLEGEIPAGRTYELQRQLPALTRGEGCLEYAFDGYQPVRGPIPVRRRWDHNPLHRKEYLLHVSRRV